MRKRFCGESLESFELVLNGDGVDGRFQFQNAAWVDNGTLRRVGDEKKNGVLKDTVGKSCDNINYSLPLSSPSKVHEDGDVADVCEPQTLVLNTCPAVPDGDGACTSELGPSHSDHGDQLSVCDLEIPSNDDICLPVIQTNYREANNNPSSSSSGHQRNGEQEISLKKNDALTLSFPASRLVGSGTMPKHPIVGFGVKAELSHGSHRDVDSKDFLHVDPRQDRSAHATPKLAMDGALKIEETDPSGLVGEHATLHAQTGSNKKFLEPDPKVDQEESEDDDDIPCYSDIETTILRRDFCPDDQDLYSSREDQSSPPVVEEHAVHQLSRSLGDVPEQHLEECTEESLNEQNKTTTPHPRKRKEKPSRKSLAGLLWEHGVRRSTRIRRRPLEYWKGERLLDGGIHQNQSSPAVVEEIAVHRHS